MMFAGSGALAMKMALICGSAVEFLGAMTMGALVSKTISKGIIDVDQYTETPELFAVAMVAVLIGAAFTTFLATVKGYPISATCAPLATRANSPQRALSFTAALKFADRGKPRRI